jgi:ParB/RepB/Spo0J family partition protein
MPPRKNQYIELPLDAISPDPDQPRRDFEGRLAPETQQALDELAANIAQLGVLEPILVRRSAEEGKYILLAGERRWRASHIAQRQTIPCIVQAGEDTDAVRLVKQLSENVLREGLSMMDTALSLKKILESYGMKQRELAKLMGKHESWVSRHLKTLMAEGYAREQFEHGRFNDLTTFETFQRLPEKVQRQVIAEADGLEEHEIPRKFVERFAAQAQRAENADHLMTANDLKDTYVPPVGLSTPIAFNDNTFDSFTRAPVTAKPVPLSGEATVHIETNLKAEQARALITRLGGVPPREDMFLATELIELLKHVSLDA